MNIAIGSFYVNKTWKLLMPCLRGHGDEFVSKFEVVFKLAAGVHDAFCDGTELSKGRNIYILCDTKYKERFFYEFLNWVKEQPYFKGNYVVGKELDSRKHMIILAVPEQFNDAYDCFLQGKYSEMYRIPMIKTLFGSKAREEERALLMKEHEALRQFQLLLINEFNATLPPTLNELRDGEYALPLKLNEEIFHAQEKQRVFFLEDTYKQWQ